LPECEPHEHADCCRKRHRYKQANKTEQMTERDRIVFAAARTQATPIAWNLAGRTD